MNLQLLSDLHLEFEPFEYIPTSADVLVLAGDIHMGLKGLEWIKKVQLNIPVIYVLGNHEYYKQTYPKLIHKLKEEAKEHQIYILENETITLDGYHFHGATLWTDFNLFGDPRQVGIHCQSTMNDCKYIRRLPNYSKMRTIDLAHIHKQSKKWLEKSLQSTKRDKNIIITHHAPSIQSIPEVHHDNMINTAYASNMETFIHEYAPLLWLHGHIHTTVDYTIGSTRIMSNPKGYPDARNKVFNPTLLINL